MLLLQIRPNIDDTEVIELLQQCEGGGDESVGGADRSKHVLLVGLHTCGDLSPIMLRMFTSCSRIVGLVNVGCCYMKLMCANEPHPPTPIGFPLSGRIRSLDNHDLSYEARELSCHALELYRSRVLSECTVTIVTAILTLWYKMIQNI